MPIPHFNIKIVQRSKGQSAVAGAAYQAGEKLFSEYDQKTKNYTAKKEVVYTEIMLPKNAPPGYADRATLWNSVEEAEKQWNAQLARRFVAALPREVPIEMLPQMVKEYCEEHFVSKGMCCDFAIHDPDPPGHNPHCHFMLTMRAIDENGKWLPKSRKVYDLDDMLCLIFSEQKKANTLMNACGCLCWEQSVGCSSRDANLRLCSALLVDKAQESLPSSGCWQSKTNGFPMI